MDAFEVGTQIEAGELQALGASAGAPIEIRASLGDLPHGARYRARQDGVGVMLTVLDPVFAADPAVWAGLRRDLEAARSRTHRSLLPIFAFGRSAHQHLLVLEHDPGGKSIRSFVRHRISRGRPLDGDAAYALVAHVCNALASLHPDVIHGYVTADTTHVSEGGRVFLSGIGMGRNLPRTPGFARHREEGRLPNVAPEQLLAMPQLTAGTDVFGVATLFLEMVTGRALVEAGQPVSSLGLAGPDDLLMCLERATAPSPGARPPDAATFKNELAEALREGPIERSADIPTPVPVLLPDVPLAGDSGSSMPKVPPSGPVLAAINPADSSDALPIPPAPRSPFATSTEQDASPSHDVSDVNVDVSDASASLPDDDGARSLDNDPIASPPDFGLLAGPSNAEPSASPPLRQDLFARAPDSDSSGSAATHDPFASFAAEDPFAAGSTDSEEASFAFDFDDPPPPAAIARSRPPPPPPRHSTASRPVVRLDPEDSVPIDLEADESNPMMVAVSPADRPPPPPARERPPTQPRAQPRPENIPVASSSSSSSMLEFALEDTGNLAERLSTIDGEDLPAEETTRPQRPRPTQAAPFDKAQTGNVYFVVRGKQMQGPLDFTTLRQRAADGELRDTDHIQDRRTGAEYPVLSIEPLAHLMATADDRAQLRKFASSRASVREGPAPAPLPGRQRPKDRRTQGTVVWIVVAIAAFVAAGWWLTTR